MIQPRWIVAARRLNRSQKATPVLEGMNPGSEFIQTLRRGHSAVRWLWYKIAPPTTRNELAGEAAARLIGALHDPPSAALAGRGGTMSQSHVLGELAAVLSVLAEHLDPPDLLGGSEAVMVALLSPDFRESHSSLTDCLRTLAGRLDKFALVNMLKWPVCIGTARTVVLDQLSVETDIDLQGNIWNVVHTAPSLGIKCRLSLRESTYFRGAKDDSVRRCPKTTPDPLPRNS